MFSASGAGAPGAAGFLVSTLSPGALISNEKGERMEPGDITSYTDHFGRRHVAVILEKLEDGRYSLFCPKPSHLAVEASPSQGDKGFVFDPTLPVSNRGDVQDAPAAPEVQDESAKPDQGE